MPSISPSEIAKVVAKLENVNLVFQADVHRAWTWRDAFTATSKDPLGFLLRERDRLHVLRDINLEIHEGERVGLMGVNGSGKTSLCRCISGMYRPLGAISVQGEVRAIFDTAVGIQPELTGRENALLLAEFMFPGDSGKRALVEEALQFSELGKFVDMPYRLYSNGMQARLCLSLSTCKPCDLLILDEVFDGADAFFREKIARRTLKMIEGSGAVVFVSHSAEQMKRVCNRILVLHQGKIGFDGAVEQGIQFYEKLRDVPPGATRDESLTRPKAEP